MVLIEPFRLRPSLTDVKAFLVALGAAAFVSGCVSSRRIEDHTTNHSSTCEVHRVVMTQKRVAMTYGRSLDAWTFELRDARRTVFPHADEVYNTYACLPSYEKYARIYVCAPCTEERAEWLRMNPQSASRSWKDVHLIVNADRSGSTGAIACDLFLTITNEGRRVVRVPERNSSFPGEVVVSCREKVFVLRNKSLMYPEPFGSPFYNTELLQASEGLTMRLRLYQDFITEEDFLNEVKARARVKFDQFKPAWPSVLASCDRCRILVTDRFRGISSNVVLLSDSKNTKD